MFFVGSPEHEEQQHPRAAEGGDRAREEDERDVQAPHDPPRQGAHTALAVTGFVLVGLTAAGVLVFFVFFARRCALATVMIHPQPEVV